MFLNSRSMQNNKPVLFNVQETELLEIFLKSQCDICSEVEATNIETGGSSKQCIEIMEMRKCIDRIKTMKGNAKFPERLYSMDRRIQGIKSQSDELFMMD